MYEARNSIYCYPNSNVLINKLDIRDGNKLYEYEKRIVSLKLLALQMQGITGNFNMQHFISIHKYLFEDLYEFAGKFRSENIAKDNFSFADYQYIESELKRLLEQLKKENYLQGIEKEELSKRIASYWADLNVLHPFRKGNGRATREFLRQLCLKNGYELNIQNVESSEFLKASKLSVYDETMLAQLVYKSLNKKQ